MIRDPTDQTTLAECASHCRQISFVFTESFSAEVLKVSDPDLHFSAQVVPESVLIILNRHLESS